MSIYYGANRIALGPDFQPPREGTMPVRGPMVAIGLSDVEHKWAVRKQEKIGAMPTGAHGKRRANEISFGAKT